MPEHDVATRPSPTADGTTSPTTHVDFLRSEFPDWEIEVGESEGWDGTVRELWIARREGDHPQSELTAAKLHTRLSGYLEREAQRQALGN